MSYLTDRRRFLKSPALTGVGVFVSGKAVAEDAKSPNERIRFACIGVGGKGGSDSRDAKSHGDVVAICDIDDNTLAKAATRFFPKAAKYNDFRKMLDEMGANIDAVTVSTPDHTHAPAALGDMACHTVNMPYMALDLRDPVAVVATTSGHNRDSYPKWSIITYDFPASGQRAACQMVWYDGGQKPSPDLFSGEQVSETGVLLIGDKGKLFAPGDYCEKGYKLLDGATEKEVQFEASPGHFEEYVRAIKGGPAARSNFPDYASPLTETILLGNLAVWAAPDAETPGKKIEWLAQSLKPTNAPEVEVVVTPEYREGYKL